MDHAESRPWRQVEIRGVDDPLHVATRPRHAREHFELGEILEHACTRAIQRHHVGWRMRVQVELGINLVLRRQRIIELVQEPSLELPRLDLEFGPRGPVDDADCYTRMTDPVAQL